MIFLILAIAALLFYTGVKMSGPGTDAIGKLAAAIGRAEGFGPVENLPTKINNPGDLELGDLGLGTQAAKTVFSSIAEGWSALRREIEIIANGQSKYYNADTTIADMAKLWTGGDNADSWAQNVASALGVTPQTRLGDVLGV